MKAEKISPQLLAMVVDRNFLNRADFILRYGGMGAVATDPHKPERAIVFVQCDAEADLSELAEDGIYVNQHAGSIRTAFLPVEQIGRLSDEPAVTRIEPTRTLRRAAVSDIMLPIQYRHARLTGKDVVIGIIGAGLDPDHASWRKRVLRVWDQTRIGRGVAEGPYGVEHLHAASAPFADSGEGNGHAATHIAPDAQYIIVRSDLNDGHIADGIRYIFRVARERGLPAVVNVQTGGRFDVHDGVDFLAEVIDAESGSGQVVCVSAETRQKFAVCAGIPLSNWQIKETRFRVPKGARTVVLTGWCHELDKIELAVRSPEGVETKLAVPQALKVEVLRSDKISPIRYVVHTFAAQQNRPNGRRSFTVKIFPDSRADESVWTLLLHGSYLVLGRVDVWIQTVSANGQLNATATFLDCDCDSPISIKSAAATRAITTEFCTPNCGDLIGGLSGLTFFDHLLPRKGRGAPFKNRNRAETALAQEVSMALSHDLCHAPAPSYHAAPWSSSAARLLELPDLMLSAPILTALAALVLEGAPRLGPDGIKQILELSRAFPSRFN